MIERRRVVPPSRFDRAQRDAANGRKTRVLPFCYLRSPYRRITTGSLRKSRLRLRSANADFETERVTGSERFAEPLISRANGRLTPSPERARADGAC